MPPDYDNNGSLALLKDLCAVASSMLNTEESNFDSIFEFLEDFVNTHGDKIEKGALESAQSMTVNPNDKEVASLFENLLLEMIAATREIGRAHV